MARIIPAPTGQRHKNTPNGIAILFASALTAHGSPAESRSCDSATTASQLQRPAGAGAHGGNVCANSSINPIKTRASERTNLLAGLQGDAAAAAAAVRQRSGRRTESESASLIRARSNSLGTRAEQTRPTVVVSCGSAVDQLRGSAAAAAVAAASTWQPSGTHRWSPSCLCLVCVCVCARVKRRQTKALFRATRPGTACVGELLRHTGAHRKLAQRLLLQVRAPTSST